LKRFCKSSLKFGLLVVLILSTVLALYVHYKGAGFDPIREIQRMKKDNLRDDALDMARLFQESQEKNASKISELVKDLEYSTSEKIKSFTWNGAVKGEVYDTYSGFGAISSDMCIVGDIRDIGIQTFKYMTHDPEFDRLIAILSVAGIGLSSTPYFNGTNALAKSTFKYLKKMPASFEKGVLKKFLSGKLSSRECEKVWNLLKKTNGLSLVPYPACQTLPT
jgi:hypothetical protein